MLCSESIRLLNELEDGNYLYEISCGFGGYTLKIGMDIDFKGKTILDVLKQFETIIMIGN